MSQMNEHISVKLQQIEQQQMSIERQLTYDSFAHLTHVFPTLT